ncbi:MAG: undecaprenyl/decaprenyl-phosphate alpha-N-acetylglucosaminyl 1-phosphate transferase [Actinomycetota bacterium]|nr:undecaprenyl/decaprenyl-phosphate alpha-N-acetylglucosaminyl 1-phosphate transferase [Actinomycetota bacterium]
MTPTISGYASVFGVAALSTFLLTFLTRRLAIRFGAVVMPDPDNSRRVHTRPLPTSGASLFLGFLVAMAMASRIGPFQSVFEGSSEPLAVVLAASVMFGVGMLDDLLEVSPPAKMAGIVFSGSVLSLLGVVMIYLRIPFLDLLGISPDLAPLLTVIWVAGMANAINFIDGLDGLAAGIVAIAAGAFFLYTLQIGPDNAGLLSDTSVGPLIAVIACGICVGFLPHNFHPARIQMGDAGALFLGLLMAAATLVVGGRTDQPFSGQTYFFYAPIFIPFFILGVPIFDTAFAIIRRSGKFSVADKGHLHHRLMFLGHGQRRSVAILWAWTALLSGLVLFPAYTDRGNAVIPFAVLGLGVLLYTFFHPGVRPKGGPDVLSTGDDPTT